MDKCENNTDLITLMRQYIEFELTGTILGKFFERMYLLDNGFSPEIKMSELETYHPSFHTTNGGDWCRSDVSYLGKKYNIIRKKVKGSIYSIKLDGYNKRTTINNSIRSDILSYYKKERCAILDVGTSIECDHKDGLKNDWRLNNPINQKLEDFQALSKAANDAKRSHCKKCKETGKRYDAKILGYSVSYLYGSEQTKSCEGCYWCDPQKFNSIISKNYKKPD